MFWRIFRTLLAACLLTLALAGNAQAVMCCATQSGIGGVLHWAGGDVTIPVQYAPSTNPQQPDLFLINGSGPAGPGNIVLTLPPIVDIFGSVLFQVDPFLLYDITLVNIDPQTPATFDLTFQTDVTGGPYHGGLTWFRFATDGTAEPIDTGAYMQTTTFQRSAGPPDDMLQLGATSCSGFCDFGYSTVDFGGGVYFNKIQVNLDVTLQPGASVEFWGGAILDAPEPAAALLTGVALTALALALRARIRKQ